MNKQKHQNDKKVLRLDRFSSTRINWAKKKIRQFWLKMIITTYISTEDLIDEIQSLERK